MCTGLGGPPLVALVDLSVLASVTRSLPRMCLCERTHIRAATNLCARVLVTSIAAEVVVFVKLSLILNTCLNNGNVMFA